MAQHSSRLNRLLTLLDTGSTQITRLTAARQIGDIAKTHPQDLNSLLQKVSQYLRSKHWDTRVAAAHAVGSIAENVKHASLKEVSDWIDKELSAVGVTEDVKNKMLMEWSNYDFLSAAAISYRSFDIAKVLESGPPLLASVGREFDITIDNKNPAERLARQKQNLRRRLGLDVCEKFMDVSDMIIDEDLELQNNFHVNGINQGYYASHSGQRAVANMIPKLYNRRLSAREKNLQKRKAKVNAKDHSKPRTEEDDFEQHLQNSGTPKGTNQDSLGSNVKVESVDDDNLDQEGNGRWPFYQFVEQLVHDMFDPIWEVRHGSIMALREIFTHQAGSVGIYMPDLSIESATGLPVWEKQVALDPMDTTSPRENIDLNLDVQICDVGPASKKLKVESEIGLHRSPLNLMDGFESKQLCQEAELENGFCPTDSVKLDPDLLMDVDLPHDPKAESVEEEKPVIQDQSPGFKGDLPMIFPQDCKLMQLMKLARYSRSKNWEFLQDCAIRFLCVLSLDRFGDYVSDQVVAPVRETCAQALGTVLKFMHPSVVHATLAKLLRMQNKHEWEVRHGSLLGIKYLVAVRLEMLPQLLQSVLPACKAGLEDADDDVRAVAAEALIPTAPALVLLHGRTLSSIVMLLWDILLDLDDLSPSTSSVMNLLSELYSQPEMLSNMSSSVQQELNLNEVAQSVEDFAVMKNEENPYLLASLAPRLWPFMRHEITSVRHSAIRTLERLLEAGLRNYNDSVNDSFWPASILGDTLRIVFQNLLLESNEDILQCTERVWRILLQSPVHDLETAARSYMPLWIQLATTPYGCPLDATKMFWPVVLPRKSRVRAAAKMRAVGHENFSDRSINFDAFNVSMSEKNGETDIHPTKMVVGADTEKSVTSTRVLTATALGLLASKLSEASFGVVIDALWIDLTSSSGVRRQVATMVLSSWFKELGLKMSGGAVKVSGLFEGIRKWLLDLLQCTDAAFPTKDSKMPYLELSKTCGKLRHEVSLLLGLVRSSGMSKILLSTVELDIETLSVDDAIKFASTMFSDNLSTHNVQEKKIFDEMETSRQRLLSTAGYLKCVQGNLHVTVSSLIAAAVVWTSELPTRLNPVILPLMAAIKREQEEVLQQKAAEALAELIFQCVARKPTPNDKLIKNLCSLTCMDPCETPQAALLNSVEDFEEQIYSPTNISISQKTKVQMLYSDEDRSRIEGFISRRGSEFALKFLCEKFGSEIFERLPRLWDCIIEVINPKGQTVINEQEIREMINGVKDPQLLINNIQVVRSIAPLVPETLKPKLLTLLPHIFECVRHTHVAVRVGASRCIASMARSMTNSVMGPAIERLIPMLSDFGSVYSRQGAGMLVSLLVQSLGLELVPYAPLLVVPLLGCMGDSDQMVRQSVTHSFAALVPLLPLARGVPPAEGLSEKLSKSAEDAQFLEQLLDNTHIDDYKLSVDLKVTLRRYQQEGINWLSFLKRFKLHGILCDDMGLGKTLQASAIVASDLAERQLSDLERVLSSLIVCPSTLVGHWAYEIEKYVDSSLMTPLQYIGSAQERMLLRNNFESFNVIITSYDVIRKDIDYLGQLSWNYCILDEGHIIKNSKSKITAAVKQLKAEHRLILSGTPIQNNVLELWSLFDFFMPGFLWTERQFQAKYGKRLLAAKDPKCSAKDAEAGHAFSSSPYKE